MKKLTKLSCLRTTFFVMALVLCGSANAQTSPKKPRATVAAPPAVEPAPTKAGEGYRFGPRGTWVVEPEGLPSAPSKPSAGSGSRVEMLIDLQVNYTAPKPQQYIRTQVVAQDAAALTSVSQPQLVFNPSYQSITIHEVAVWRDGRKLDRAKDARVETMRRETHLERLTLDGLKTLLLILNDIRVGDAVEVAYTIEGENPIFDGRIGYVIDLASSTPIELLHARVVAPRAKTLQVKGLATDIKPERFDEGPHQVIRVVRRQVPAVVTESGTPPWFKVYPSIQVTEYGSWGEVASWASKLFSTAQTAGPQVNEKIAQLKASGLQGGALVNETLKFVQDEIRYFSVSLGESSHRPKAAEQTMAERMGDCKDKVVLLNTLLSGLGFDPKPALVSSRRNRGITGYLPGHEQFDHVITRLDIEGTPYWLDATIADQGTTLATRGYFAYGTALVVTGNDTELQRVAQPHTGNTKVEYIQRWDFSQPDQAGRLVTSMVATGMAAESWRRGISASSVKQAGDALAGSYVRIMPGLVQVGDATFADDREKNTATITMSFEAPVKTTYKSGYLEFEAGAIELFDSLTGPSEPTRRSPFLLDRYPIASTLEVKAPRAFAQQSVPAFEVNDRHFTMSARVQASDKTLTVTRRVQFTSDEVTPSGLTVYRENVARARSALIGTMRLPMLDFKQAGPAFAVLDQRYPMRETRDDGLMQILFRNEITKIVDTQVLAGLQPTSVMAGRVLASRAVSFNLLGDFEAGLKDADAALSIDASSEDALDARGGALVGLGRLDDAYQTFERLSKTDKSKGQALIWMGDIESLRGRYAQAEALLREAVTVASGPDKTFALIRLFIAAEHQGQRGKSAVAPYLNDTGGDAFPDHLLKFVTGSTDQDTLLKQSRERKENERLNLAEAYYYIGQLLHARGKSTEAQPWYERAIATKATPYREVTFAQLLLGRGKAQRTN